jgi:hypothetical protein
MPQKAVIVSRSGGVSAGLPEAVSASGYEVEKEVVTDRGEDGRYYLSPATVDRLEAMLSSSDNLSCLVVDAEVHPGQAVDLTERLPVTTFRDRRGAFLEGLGEGNPAAAARFELWRSRISRRKAAREQRDGQADGPTGEAGRLGGIDGRIQRIRDEVRSHRKDAHDRVTEAYTDADGYAVLVGDGVRTTEVWASLTDGGTERVGLPSQAVTDTVTVGPHRVAVTDLPEVPEPDSDPDSDSEPLPEWFREAVPGVPAALERASLVLGVGESREDLTGAVSEEFGCDTAVGPTAEDAKEAIADAFGTVEYAFRLPYGDAAHAFVSRLHDEAEVGDVRYDEEILVRATVSRSAEDRMKRRAREADGEAVPAESFRE